MLVALLAALLQLVALVLPAITTAGCLQLQRQWQQRRPMPKPRLQARLDPVGLQQDLGVAPQQQGRVLVPEWVLVLEPVLARARAARRRA